MDAIIQAHEGDLQMIKISLYQGLTVLRLPSEENTIL
jgi:hypothetical protein